MAYITFFFIHCSSIFHPILRESHGSQEFHRTGGFDGAWPMTLAPELAKLKGCWDWWANMWRKNGQNMWVKHGKTVFAMEKTWKNPRFSPFTIPTWMVYDCFTNIIAVWFRTFHNTEIY